MDKSRVGILLFDDVEVLDYAGPFEVFSVAMSGEDADLRTAYEVLLISESGSLVTTRGGMRVEPHASFANQPALDIVVVPGGWGTRREIDNPVVIDWVRRTGQQVRTVTSVCTGSFLLGAAGLLGGKTATTHWQSLDRMRDTFPDVDVSYDLHVVKDGNLYTSAGIAAGIDMALRVVADDLGETVARRTATYMEYPFPESWERRVAT